MTRRFPQLNDLLAVRASIVAIRICYTAYSYANDYPIAHHYIDSVLINNILGCTNEMHKRTISEELFKINTISYWM